MTSMLDRLATKYKKFSGPWKKAIIGTFIFYWFAAGFAGRVFGWNPSLQDFLTGWALTMAALWIAKNTIQAAMYRAMFPDDEEEEADISGP